MLVRIGSRGPGDLPPPEGVNRTQHRSAADLLVALRSEPGPNQFAPVCVEQYGVSLHSQMNACSISQVRHLVGLPDLLAGACLQTDQFSRRARREHMVTLKQRGRGVAENP